MALSMETLHWLINLLMRAPGLFIVDLWWQFDPSKSTFKGLLKNDYVRMVQVNMGLLYGLAVLLLPRKGLIKLYMFAMFIVVLVVSHYVSQDYIVKERYLCQIANSPCRVSLQSTGSHLYTAILHILFTLALNFLTENLAGLFLMASHHWLAITRLMGLPIQFLPCIQVMADVSNVVAAIYYICLKQNVIAKIAEDSLRAMSTYWEPFDFTKFVTLLWKKLMVPRNFLVFWLVNMVLQAVELYQMGYEHSFTEKPFHYVLHCVSGVCRTPVSLVATAVVIYYGSQMCIQFSIMFLEADDDDDPMHTGWTQGLMMLILGLQTGIMDIPVSDRASTLLVILFVVISSLLQCIMEITEPVVLSLSATRSGQRGRHRRALCVCGLLFILPLLLTASLAGIFSVDFWILIVLSTCILTSIRVLGTLVVHGLFVYDGMFDRGPDLDDVVYYARSLTKILEFFVAIFVVVAGIYENTTGKWSIANTTILIVHSYCNVYRRMQDGWRSFLLRREASIKTEALATPTEEELEAYNDVCPICYQWLTAGGRSMCTTPCSHYFHRACLKKWLYSQDKCPMCHQQIISSDSGREAEGDTAMHVIQALEQEAQ